MSSKDKQTPSSNKNIKTVPFESVQDAWFWFIAAQAAKNDGARVTAGAGIYPRPCEPLDILTVLDKLYRNRRIVRDHLLVLRHYGRRNMAPDPYVLKESRAYRLWSEAMERMEPILERKGIVKKPHWSRIETLNGHKAFEKGNITIPNFKSGNNNSDSHISQSAIPDYKNNVMAGMGAVVKHPAFLNVAKSLNTGGRI